MASAYPMRYVQTRDGIATLIHDRIDPYVAMHQDQGTPRHEDVAPDLARWNWIETMSAPIAKTQFAFELPKLSYVDASWEERIINEAETAERAPSGFTHWLARRIAAFRAWREHRVAMNELALMTDRELADIGLHRGDLPGVLASRNG